MRIWIAGALLALIGASPAMAADCSIAAQTSSAGSQAVYDPFAPQNTVVDLQVTASNQGSESCVARFYVSPLIGRLVLSGPTEELLYRVESSSRGGMANEYGPFTVNVPAGGSQSMAVRFTLPAQQIVAQGSYVAELTLRGETEDGASVQISGNNPRLTVAVPSRAEMSISGTAAPPFADQNLAPAAIHFGQASSGQTDRVYVNVWANGGVLVSITSENGGVLKNVTDRTLPPIGYSATFDGAPLALTGTQTMGRVPPKSIQGASYELAITLGDTSRNFAGRYLDRITVDVNAN